MSPLSPQQRTQLLQFLWSEPPTEAEVAGHASDIGEFLWAALSDPRFDRAYKLHRTSGYTAPQDSRRYDLVNFGDIPNGMDFFSAFQLHYSRALGAREESFRRLFDEAVQAKPQNLTIIETGCLRVAGNWQGDGQSTFLFDHFAETTGSSFWSVDINPYSVDTARQVCSSRTSIVLNDSVAFLSSLGKLGTDIVIDILYLDSFDFDPNNPIPSSLHHLKELAAAMPYLRKGSLVCIDDCVAGTLDGRPVGKGMFANDYLRNIRAECLYGGYQFLWRIT